MRFSFDQWRAGENLWGAPDEVRSEPSAKLAAHLAALTPPVENVVEPPDIPGNTSTPHVLAIGSSETGNIGTSGDDDWFAVTLVAGQSYVFSMTPSGASPIEDTYLELYSSSGQLIGVDDDGSTTPGSTNSVLRWTATTSGTYYINARAWEPESPISGYTGTGTYTISAAIGAAQNPLDTINLGLTTPTHIDVYFSTSGQTQSFGPPGNQTSITASRSWTPAEIDLAMAALQLYSTYTNLTFAQTATQSNAEWALTLGTLDAGTLGWFATYNGLGYGAFAPNGTGWSADANGGLNQGGLGWVTLIHEFGHGLGLAHPHDNGGVSEIMQGVTGPFDSLGTFSLNQGVFTTMTYNDGWVSQFGGSATNYGAQGTPMALDIALLQQRYGANMTTNSGNTTYILPDANQVGTYFRAIWDAGGIDTIQHNGVSGSTIDLRAATLQNAVGGGGWVSSALGIMGGFTIANGVVIENAIGGAGADTIIGNSAANTLIGNEGFDNLDGGDGADNLQGGTGNDTLSGGDGDDQLNGGQGADTINGGAGFDTVRYDGASAGVTIYVDAPYANTGEAAGDVLTSIEGFVGSTFNDYMVGGVANNVLQGFSGADILEGHGGDDLLDGGDGDDNLQGGLGGDILDGGAGFDTARYDGATSGVTIYVDAAYANTGEAAGDTAISIEGIVGSTFNDYLVGGTANNVLQGYIGDDILEGHGGNDLLDGGDGNDQLNGGTGGDIYDGGAGFDTARYDGATAGVIAFMTDAWANTGEAAGDTYISIEALYGTNFNDTLAGASNSNELQGFDGTDFLYGYGGNDFLGGGGGDDFLDGGIGQDQLQGGAGNDQFIFRAGESNGDSVLDFTGNGPAAGDTLLFLGYGTAAAGATFEQIDATHWRITSADGLIQDIITLTNGASVNSADYIFGTG